MKGAGHVACIGKRRVLTGLWGNLKERDHLKDLDEDNIKMYIQEVGWEHGMDWYGSYHARVMGYAVTRPRVPYNAANFLTSWRPVSFSRTTSLQAVSHSLRIYSTYITDKEFITDLARNWIILQKYTYWREIFVMIWTYCLPKWPISLRLQVSKVLQLSDRHLYLVNKSRPLQERRTEESTNNF